jgi:tRNA dimethylallyltransferase
MKPKKYLIVVGGPTASGKTRLAIDLARYYDTCILSADSRQFYQEMEIGTAKPDAEERALATHHFIDSHSIADDYSVGDFAKEALTLLEQLFVDKDVVVLAGGSGLYINAVCQGLDQFPEVPSEVRADLEALYEKEGLSSLQELLRKVDPVYAAQVDLQNPRRMIRALSVHKVSGQPFSWFLQQKLPERPFQPIYLQLHWNRKALYDRINHRVDLMLAAGLEQEVRSLQAYQDKTALATVGYQELFDYFDGKTDLATAVELIKRNSRRYAKRQLTWMRRDGFWKQFTPNQLPEIIKYVEWRQTTALQLQTNSDPEKKNSQLGFVNSEGLGVFLETKEEKLYAWGRLPTLPDEQILFYLLDEWLLRSKVLSHYLFSPKGKELFLADLGFLPIEDLEKVPSHLQIQLEGEARCYRKEIEE